MTYDARETSVEDGKPVELYTMVLSGRTYRMTTAEEDVTYLGYAYQATPGLARGPVSLMQVGSTRQLEVQLPRNHPASVVLMSNGIPPRTATIVISRLHRSDTGLRQLWRGNIFQARLSGQYLQLRIPNSADAALNTSLPWAKVSWTCQHMLYGPGCEINRDYDTFDNHQFMSVASAISQTGRTLLVNELLDEDDLPRTTNWSQYGEVRRVVDGERRSILLQAAAVGGIELTLDMPFAYLEAGDDLEVYAGCDHTMADCDDKFANNLNFGGHNEAPSNNPINIQDED